MPVDLKSHMAEQLSQALRSYVNDLKALDDVRLGQSLGGVARTPYDFTFEVVTVNRRIVTRLTGGDPGPFASEGWMTAPEEFQSKDAAVAELEASGGSVLDAWNALPESDLGKEIQTPGGSTSPLKLVGLATTHLVYHDAQLNYIQALLGDDEMHWD